MAKKTTFTATASTSGSTPHSATGVTIDDFVAYLPKHVYIFTVVAKFGLAPASMLACRQCKCSPQAANPSATKTAN